MPDLRSKEIVLAALRREPCLAGIGTLPDAESRKGRRALRWLDESGLALAFWRQLEKFGATRRMAIGWQDALGARVAQNRIRTEEMKKEFRRLLRAFGTCAVRAVALKGFTLVPDFCEDAYLRHQVDFDFLVEPPAVGQAAAALRTCGYSASAVKTNGETCFTTPLRHIPSHRDNVYQLQSQRQVDLHVGIWEQSEWTSIIVPEDCVERAEVHFFEGEKSFELPLEDKFLLHVLHVYRHSLRSWVRLSWILELCRFLELHQDDQALWNRIVERAGDSRGMRKTFVFVLGLAGRAFHASLPGRMRAWLSEAMTVQLEVWLDHFGLEWALADWPGSLSNVLVASELIGDSGLQKAYRRNRIWPRNAQTSIGEVAGSDSLVWGKVQLARLGYLVERAVRHARDLAKLPAQQRRWKHALEASERRALECEMLNC
jgi:Uncharacterised nucleotidyltransferase